MVGRSDLVRADWHLQHSRVLASGQFRHQDDRTQFESIAVNIRLVLIDLPRFKPSI